MSDLIACIKDSAREIRDLLENGIIPFWLKNGIDNKYGGYMTCFDADGNPSEDTDKYIVTQTRMLWGMSALYRVYPENIMLLDSARQGANFFIKYFWDPTYGGWYWRVKRSGDLVDNGKLLYGQSFAIYALCEYTLSTGDPIGVEYAEKTFDLIQKYCSDTFQGGYFENFEPDWKVSGPGFTGGDRKSLDIHMHILEAYTTLVECTGKEIHKRKLDEVIQLILSKMVNLTAGCALNQFDVSFKPIPAIDIKRTWNAERVVGEVIQKPTDTTSYGHNVELVWLLNRAGEVLGKPSNYYDEITSKLVYHSIKFGFDHELGGVYRDGPHEGPAYVFDKEWWQNCEVLVGYLDAFERLGDLKYFDAFHMTWNFDKKYMVNHQVGEFRQLLDRKGNILAGDIGNPWKAIYHSGRSMLECINRLERMSARLEDELKYKDVKIGTALNIPVIVKC